MPSNASIRASAAALLTSRHPHRPLIAVFFAGAAGIGHYTLRELARATANALLPSGFRAYIVARKEQAAQNVIAECLAILEGGTSNVSIATDLSGEQKNSGIANKTATAEFAFVQTSDLSLMVEVDRVCARITELERGRAECADGHDDDVARIDYLLFTQGCTVYQPRKGARTVSYYLLCRVMVDAALSMQLTQRGKEIVDLTDIYTDTKEGLDFTMAMLYYSRMRALTQLLPLLKAASSPLLTPKTPPPTSQSPRPHATVISVFAAGMESESAFHPSNLSLDSPVSQYSYNTARSHMAYMHTLFFEHLAANIDSLPTSTSSTGELVTPSSSSSTSVGARLTLAHVFPGLVNGPAFSQPELPSWFRTMWKWFVEPVAGWAIFTKPEVCGMRLLSLADGEVYPPVSASSPSSSSTPAATAKGFGKAIRSTAGEEISGTYVLGSRMDDIFDKSKYKGMDREKMRDAVWKHTMGAFEMIATRGVYNGSAE